MEPSGTIYERMAWLMDHLPVIKKREVKAGNQRYKAFAIDDIYLEFHPHFATAGVFIMPQVESVEYVTSGDGRAIDARVIVTYTFYAPDGTNVAMRVAAEGRDYQDKATNKALQQAIKYGLIQAFLQPTGEPDADTERLEAEDVVISAKDVTQLTNAARLVVYDRVKGDLDTDAAKEEAGRAWPLVLEKAGVKAIGTPEDRDKVISAARELFPTADEAPFEEKP